MTTLRLILGDQLNARHSWFQEKSDDTLYLIAELKQETTYVKHHIQKLCAFFLSMARFAQALDSAGHRVLHLTLDDTWEYDGLEAMLSRVFESYQVSYFEYQRPDEYRLLQQLRAYDTQSMGIQKSEVDTEYFLLPFDELSKHFKADKAHRMEAFYRRMRKRYDILMNGDEPLGGRWNFDQDNRNSFTAKDIAEIPSPLIFSNDIRAVLERVNRHQIAHFGETETRIVWPCDRQQALALLEAFIQENLPRFGTFQDAMTDQSPHAWSLYHSRLSFAINSKILSPYQVIRRVLEYCEDNPEHASLAQIEGFVRQLLGWREYIRGMYWANMPTYHDKNFFEAKRPLPSWFWSADTKMNCLRNSIHQSLHYAYAHHIQRLMVIGNFALLAGLDPAQVDAWYLGVYIDAIEWVELPNTRGMSQFADGGLIASKPYAASGNYINKMSDYCKGCDYNPKLKNGDTACPFNALYWDFLNRHSSTLKSNPRMAFPYKQLDRMSHEQLVDIQARARYLIDNIETL